MEALAEADWEFEGAVVGGENDDVAGGIENGRADFAVLEVAFNVGAEFDRDTVVNVVGDVSPDVFAVQFHGILPQNPLRSGAVVSK